MYRIFQPHPALSPYIRSYWLLRANTTDTDAFQVDVFTDLRADIMFNFGDGYRRAAPDGVETITDAYLDATRTHPIAIHQSGNLHLLAVRLALGGLAAFTPVHLLETLNLTLDLVDIFGKDGIDLTSRLYEVCHSPQEQITLLDGFFLQLLAPPDNHATVTHAADVLAGGASVRGAGDAVGYSARSLNRLFRGVYGVPPAVYVRVARFRGAYHTLQYNPAADLTTLALRHGFYDLPHFSREFKAFTGVAPTRYRQQMSDLYKQFAAASSTLVTENM